MPSAGLGRTLLMMVPPYLAVSGTPYSLSLPKLCVVTPAMVLPKFHTQTPRPETPCSYCSSMKAEPAACGPDPPELLSLSGVHGFCG